MKPSREMTATEVAAVRRAAGLEAAARRLEERRIRGEGLRVYPPASGLYDETDVTLHGAKIAAGHNPAGLTVAQVGAGFRLLAPEEILPPPDSRAYTEGIQRWIAPNWDGSKWRGMDATGTFRTRKPPGFFLPATKVAVDIESEYKPMTAREALGAAAAPAPDARRYVYTFVCNACPRTCTMETVSANPHFTQLPSDMLCPYRLPGFTALWEAGGPVQTLT